MGKFFPVDENRPQVLHPINIIVNNVVTPSYAKQCCNMLLTTLFMGCSTTLLKLVFINREQVERFYTCSADSLSHWLAELLSVMHTISALQYQQFLPFLVGGHIEEGEIATFRM